MSETDVWSFETKREDRRLRLDAVQLAVRMHEAGMAEDGDTALQTAAKLMAFIGDD